MSINAIIRHVLLFIIIFALQIVLFRYWGLFNLAFSFIHIGYIIMAQKDDKHPVIFLLSAFLMGLAVDVLETTPGINAFACTLIAFIRPQFITLFDLNQYENQMYTVKNVGFVEYFLFGGVLSFIYSLTYFTLESFDIIVFFKSGFFRSIFSAVYTILLIILLQYLFVSKHEGE